MHLFRQYKASIPSWKKVDIDTLCNEVLHGYTTVLAILLILRMGHAITQLRNDGVSDAKLSLMYNNILYNDLHFEGQSHAPIKCFQDPAWHTHIKEGICRLQWHLNVPYLKVGSNFVAERMELSSKVILSWCRPDVAPLLTIRRTVISQLGGHSFVKQVYIHPSFHGFHDNLEEVCNLIIMSCTLYCTDSYPGRIDRIALLFK